MCLDGLRKWKLCQYFKKVIKMFIKLDFAKFWKCVTEISSKIFDKISLSANQKSVTQFSWGNGPMGIEAWTTAESTLSNCQKNQKISEKILVKHFQNFSKYNLIYIFLCWNICWNQPSNILWYILIFLR